LNPVLQKVSQAVIEGRPEAAEAAVRAALDAGLDAKAVLDDGLVAAMGEVGRLFECREVFVPEMLLSARAMQKALDFLKPRLTEGQMGGAGRVVIGTVKGDLHDIGKNLVAVLLKGAGFEVFDLGSDVAPERFVDAVRERGQVVALSALLTTTMLNMKAVVDALAAAGLRDKVRVVVGGAPLTDEFAKRIGADGYAPDAGRAVALVRSLLASNPATA
jgi:5-methyltetrahydrofolate--homocysteine methyltransferase